MTYAQGSREYWIGFKEGIRAALEKIEKVREKSGGLFEVKELLEKELEKKQ